MDKQFANALAREAEEVLQVLAEKHGLTVKWKGGTIDGPSVTMKMEFAETGEAGVIMSREAVDFQRYAVRYDLDPDDLGAAFMASMGRVVIVGLKPRATKMPILVETEDGKRYKMAAEAVKRGLDLARQPT